MGKDLDFDDFDMFEDDEEDMPEFGFNAYDWEAFNREIAQQIERSEREIAEAEAQRDGMFKQKEKEMER